jgi:hypothetical protein
MAAKKGPKPSARFKGGKKAAKAKGKKSSAAGKKAPPTGPKKVAAALSNKHRQLRIGLERKTTFPRVITGQNNTFSVFGDAIGTGNPQRKLVTLAATAHGWDPPSDVRPNGRDSLRITARCQPVVRGKRAPYTDDDLTVTIQLEGTPEVTDCHFDDVEYDA